MRRIEDLVFSVSFLAFFLIWVWFWKRFSLFFATFERERQQESDGALVQGFFFLTMNGFFW
jgi:hypothetical protein